jgi:hypothetical protein
MVPEIAAPTRSATPIAVIAARSSAHADDDRRHGEDGGHGGEDAGHRAGPARGQLHARAPSERISPTRAYAAT